MSEYSEDAVDFAKQNFGVALDFSYASIEQVEAIPDRLYRTIPHSFMAKLFRKVPSEADLDQICKMLGGYIGEVFRRAKGGDWAINPEFNVIGVQRDEAWIFPSSKVHQRLSNGAEDNLWMFFRVMCGEPWERRSDS